jgi:ATP-binding cassette, subfamily B, bacterial
MTDSATKDEEADSRNSSRIGGFLYLYRELWRHSHGHRLMLAGGVLLLAGGQAILLTIPYLAGRAINALQVEGLDGLGTAFFWLMSALAVSVVVWLLHGPGTVLARNISVTIRRRIATELIDRLFKLPLAWHAERHSGASAHRVIQSSSALSSFAEHQFEYLGVAIKVFGPVVALWLIHPYVGIAATVGLGITCLAIASFERKMIRLAHQKNAAERRYAAALIDALANSTTMIALRQARTISAMILKKMDAIFIPFRRTIIINEVKWCTIDLTTRVLACFLVVLFAWLTTRKSAVGADAGPTLMLGNLYMVWEYAQRASGIMVEAALKFQTLAKQQADYSSAAPIRAAQPESFGRIDGESAGQWNRCEVLDVVFRHQSNRTVSPAIDSVSVTLERGRRYALIGNSGSGKSTLMRVLAGLYIAEKITVVPAGMPRIISALEAAKFLRGCTTLIPQDAELFEGSLADNLSFCESVIGAPSLADFSRALRLAAVDEFIEVGPESMQASIAERAANWSGGQRARIALARGILAAHGSALVMLDEPTASLDAKTEAIVYQNIFTEFADACLIASVHRLNLLPRFDEVIVMRDGQVVAQGPASFLAHNSQEYRDLCAAGIRQSSMDAMPH